MHIAMHLTTERSKSMHVHIKQKHIINTDVCILLAVTWKGRRSLKAPALDRYLSTYLLLQKVVDILVEYQKTQPKHVPTSSNEGGSSLEEQASKVLQEWEWILNQCITVLQEWFMIVLTWKLDEVSRLLKIIVVY